MESERLSKRIDKLHEKYDDVSDGFRNPQTKRRAKTAASAAKPPTGKRNLEDGRRQGAESR